MLEFDGADGSTTIPDFSTTPATITANNGAAVSTQRPKFGTGSLFLDGTNDWVNTNRTQAVGTGPFTLEAHIRPTVAQTGRIISSQDVTTSNPLLALRVSSTGQLTFLLRNAAGSPVVLVLTSPDRMIAMNDTAWYHVAATRDASNRIDIWIDGQSVGNASSAVTPATAPAYRIGVFDAGTAQEHFGGFIDNVRITEGVCRYTGPFVPPAAPYPHSSSAALASAEFRGWLDELSVMIGTAAYSANYTPESAAFPDPSTGGVEPSDFPTLILDRGLDWDGTPEPHAVMLSSELNEVSAALACHRGDADHECVLDVDAPFDLFGKGDHQEPTRVAFGTVDNIVRDWIVTSATPQQGLVVHIEGLTYNPDVYDGAMPHQGGEALPLPPPPGGWMIAGTADALSSDWCIAGTAAAPSTDRVIPGTVDAPVIWLEETPP